MRISRTLFVEKRVFVNRSYRVLSKSKKKKNVESGENFLFTTKVKHDFHCIEFQPSVKKGENLGLTYLLTYLLTYSMEQSPS